MVDNLVFSLNATIPIFLMMVLGYILKRIHWLTDSATDVINRLVFELCHLLCCGYCNKYTGIVDSCKADV